MTTTPHQRPPEGARRRLLPPEVVAGGGQRPDEGAAASAWDGVVWGRLGRADRAWAAFRVAAQTDPALRPWAEAERGRVLRELGLHDQATWHDRAGLELATDPLDTVMLRLSLAADAIGRGDLETAATRRSSAVALLEAAPDGPRSARQRMRLAWVDVELAQRGAGEPPREGLPRRGDDGEIVQPSQAAHGTPFHAAKGLLYAGVLHRDRGFLQAAAELAPPMLAWAVQLARLDRGVPGALDQAVAAWTLVEPPSALAADVAATPTARRLARLAELAGA